ncbi:hypothetical protein Esti_002115 [Eimeria stiedai]
MARGERGIRGSDACSSEAAEAAAAAAGDTAAAAAAAATDEEAASGGETEPSPQVRRSGSDAAAATQAATGDSAAAAAAGAEHAAAAAAAAAGDADAAERESALGDDEKGQQLEEETDAESAAPTAAAAGKAAAVDENWGWGLWPAEWQVLPFERIASLFMETFTLGGGDKRVKGHPNSSSSSGSSSRDSSTSKTSRAASATPSRSRRGRRASRPPQTDQDAAGTHCSFVAAAVAAAAAAVASALTLGAAAAAAAAPRTAASAAAAQCVLDSAAAPAAVVPAAAAAAAVVQVSRSLQRSPHQGRRSSPGSSSSGGDRASVPLGSLGSRRFPSRSQRLRSKLSQQRLARRSAAAAVRRSSSRPWSRDSSSDRKRGTGAEDLGSERETPPVAAAAAGDDDEGETPSLLESWMGCLGLSHVPIHKLVIPATHNSASWRVARLNEQQAYYCRLVQVWVSCQQLSIYEQLRRGIRWLDLRCCKSLEAVTLKPRRHCKTKHRSSALTRHLSSRVPPMSAVAAASPGSHSSRCLDPYSKSPFKQNTLQSQHSHQQRRHQQQQQQGEGKEEWASGFEAGVRLSPSTHHHHTHHHSKHCLEEQEAASAASAAAAAAAAHRDGALATGARRVAVARELEGSGVQEEQHSIPFCAHGGVLTVPLLRVLEEVHAFLVRNPTEVVFLSCVPDEGVVGEAFCRLKAISASELDFCVGSALASYLGPPLKEGDALSDLVARGQRVVLLWSHQERCLPGDCDFACQRGSKCPCRAASAGRSCYASLVMDWVKRVEPIFSAANKPGGSWSAASVQVRTKAKATPQVASGSDTASTRADNSSTNSDATTHPSPPFAAPEAAAAGAGGRHSSSSSSTGAAFATFVQSPFRPGGCRLFKSYYKTGTMHSDELVKNLLHWAAQEQRAVALQRKLETTTKDNSNPTNKHPITFRMLCGEVTAPRKFGELPFLAYWLGQGVAAWRAKPLGIKTAARETNRRLLHELLKPLLQQVQAWAATCNSSGSSGSGSSEAGEEEEEVELPPAPLENINAFSHDYADRRLVMLLLRINCALHGLPDLDKQQHKSTANLP